jgi:hypothetical protein
MASKEIDLFLKLFSAFLRRILQKLLPQVIFLESDIAFRKR